LADARPLAAVDGRIVRIAAQQLHAMAQVAIGLAPLQHVALAQDRGDVAGEVAEPALPRPHHHVGEAGMHTELRHPAPMGSRQMIGADCLQLP
jgi:hypothetical protein